MSAVKSWAGWVLGLMFQYYTITFMSSCMFGFAVVFHMIVIGRRYDGKSPLLSALRNGQSEDTHPHTHRDDSDGKMKSNDSIMNSNLQRRRNGGSRDCCVSPAMSAVCVLLALFLASLTSVLSLYLITLHRMTPSDLYSSLRSALSSASSVLSGVGDGFDSGDNSNDQMIVIEDLSNNIDIENMEESSKKNHNIDITMGFCIIWSMMKLFSIVSLVLSNCHNLSKEGSSSKNGGLLAPLVPHPGSSSSSSSSSIGINSASSAASMTNTRRRNNRLGSSMDSSTNRLLSQQPGLLVPYKALLSFFGQLFGNEQSSQELRMMKMLFNLWIQAIFVVESVVVFATLIYVDAYLLQSKDFHSFLICTDCLISSVAVISYSISLGLFLEHFQLMMIRNRATRTITGAMMNRSLRRSSSVAGRGLI